jgi:predicted dehydrogenase
MRQVAQNYKTGELVLLEVPVPACRPGGVVVRSEHSLISAGTERMKVTESKMSLAAKARARPDQVRKVAETVAQQGVVSTYRKVMNRLDSYTPLGYSLAGIVVEAGEGVDLVVGQRVACGGNQHALHAEYNWVPQNLCVPVPDHVISEHAAFTTVGAIAMQGFRQAEPRLGEVALVIGLGLVGQLLVQILVAAGARVVGLDPSPERCRLAESVGATACGAPVGEDFDRVEARLQVISDGAGADHVFLAASTDSRDPVVTAAKLARDRGRIVDIGKCNLDLPWNDYYEKELDFRFSRSYGPGRYDEAYEEQGIDYPIGYVRWTERRNMKSFVDLVADGRIELAPLVSQIVPFGEAVTTYERLNAGELGGIGILFEYDRIEPGPQRVVAADRIEFPPGSSPSVPVARFGVIGAGNYATTMLLPYLAERSDVRLVEVTTSTALSAATAARRFGFERMGTEYQHAIEADDIDAVVIATRHGTHALMAAEALRAGKAVFLEKPLAVDEPQLETVVGAMRESGNRRLMVGFNRRFAPLLNTLRDMWGPRSAPHVVTYVVNAGKLGADSWYGQAPLHGSRFIGEGCHFVDTVSWWLGVDPVSVWAAGTPDDPDNLVATLRYPDGSIATISYLTQGDVKHPKETLMIYGEGKVARLANFRRIDTWFRGKRRYKRTLKGVDKGQRGELDAFVRAVVTGSSMPIPVESIVATTRATFAAERSALSGQRDVVIPFDSPRLQDEVAP